MGGGGSLPEFSFFLFPVQQTTSGIDHGIKFRVGNQYAEREKQQQSTVGRKKIVLS